LAGLLYYFLTWVGLQALKRLEEKTRIPGLGIETEAKIAKNDQSA
jgi:hypothetical protein